MGDGHTIISCIAVFDLVSAGSESKPVEVDLCYNSRDPFAVQASFRTGQNTVEWVFARDLLNEGLHTAVGTGDVRVRPATDDPQRVELELNSPSGYALFTTSAPAMRDFLRRTFRAVPAGSEYTWLDLDLALADLLSEKH